MTESNTSTPVFHISADLWPGDANAARTQLMEWLSEQTSDATVELGSETTEPSVSALQLLVAATRRTSGPHPVPGEIASATLAAFAKPKFMKRDE